MAGLGRYRLVERLGAGGMGIVHRAHDPSLQRDIAVKRLFSGQDSTPRERRRFLGEARAMAGVVHPNVVQIFDVGESGREVFLAMELLAGPTLRRACEGRPWRPVVRFYAGAGRGLAALHRERLVHRDFKPDNVLLSHDGTPKVMDLGLAKRLCATTRPGASSTHGSSFQGVRAGSFPYMAAECFEGHRRDASSDQFAFCVALFESLAGRRPFESNSPWGHWLAVTTERPSAQRREMPRSIFAVLERGLRRDPADRWPSMEALVERLEACLSRRAPKMMLGLGAVAAISAATPSPSVGAAAVDETVCVAPLSLDWIDRSQLRVNAHLDEIRRGAALPAASHATERIEAAIARLAAMNESECATATEALCRGRLATRLEVAMEDLEALDADTVSQTWGIVAPLADECHEDEDSVPIERALAVDEALVRAKKVGLDRGLPAAQAQVADAVEAADGSGSRSLAVDARMEAAGVLTSLGDSELAFQYLTKAAWTARFDDRPDEAGRAALQAAHVAAVGLHDPGQAKQWLERAEPAVDPELSLRWARFVATRALVARAEGRFADAEADMREAARIRSNLAPNDPESALTWSAVGSLMQQRGKNLEGRRVQEHALRKLVEVSDPLHPEVVIPLYGLAVGHLLTGDLEAAELLARTVLQVEPTAHGPAHPSHVYDRLLLAEILAARGRQPAALAVLQEAADMARDTFGPEHSIVAEIADKAAALHKPS